MPEPPCRRAVTRRCAVVLGVLVAAGACAAVGVRADEPVNPPAETEATPPAEETPQGAAEAVAAAPQPVRAVWFDRDISFAYMGRTTYYTCDGLRSKVTKILQQMGVKPGFKVSVMSCFENYGVEMMPMVRIRGAFPTEVTPELLEELSKDAPERELLRRSQGLPTDFDPALDEFAAVRTTIVFKDGRFGPIDPGDCELIEALRDDVFVPVGMIIVEDRVRCQPGQVSLGSINLKVSVLEQPAPLEAPAQEPGKAEDGDSGTQ